MSQSQFEQMFIAQRDVLLRVLGRMVDNASAEDLLQEAYLRVRRALNEHPVEHLRSFVFQTARNLALDHLRARRCQARILIDDAPLAILHNVPAPLSPAEDCAHATQVLERLAISLKQLSHRQQRIFLESCLHGCSYQEIAEQLAVSISTVQKELKLIKAFCAEVVERVR